MKKTFKYKSHPIKMQKTALNQMVYFFVVDVARKLFHSGRGAINT